MPSNPQIKAHMVIAHETDAIDETASLPVKGAFSQGRHRLIFTAPEDDGLALRCTFDGHNWDRCVGEIGHHGHGPHGEPCAEFIFHRVHAVEDDDDDDDHEEFAGHYEHHHD